MILAGCESVPAFSFAPSDAERAGRVATQEVMLRDGLRVRAPCGKCVDTRRTRQRAGQATVVIANCSNLGGRRDIGAPDPGLVLVTVTPGAHGDLDVLQATLRANPGLLARSGLVDDVDLISIKTSPAALYANLIDVSPGAPDGVSPRHWKAALDVAGRAIIISVFGKEGGPLPQAEGETLARNVAQALLDANAGLATPVETVPPGDATVETPPESTENTPQSFMERSFRAP